ncbi:hypothetical protein, conserved [Plasmodium gonderi]|uniref:Uncharacterized protein n=1 Tax=Plasmodium gonderi TaxID=77519 RepID=A0A1Y1JKG2_PLAGO|nr:hypothetical protein, conserved [Plasmodium gonderi]GAW81925.1 hypothetical protein, conserved [Plasmodium gonderi]
MRFLFFYPILCSAFVKNVGSIFHHNFSFTFKEVKQVSTSKSDINKFEMELMLSFNKQMTSKEFFLTSFIPAKNLHVLSFKRDNNSGEQENVEIRLNKEEVKEKDPCDYQITSKMYLLKLHTEELKKFKIYRYPFTNKQNPPEVPSQYEYSEKSLKNFFPSEGIIYASNYYLKFSVEINKNQFNSDDIWIFSISEKNKFNTGNQECVIYSGQLAEVFLPRATHNDTFLLYCNSTTNAELLNLVPELRRKFDVQIKATKMFYGAQDAIYIVQMDLEKIASPLKLNQVMIRMKLPLDLCYANSCFSKNRENPCSNIKSNPFDECTYIFRNYEFIFKSKESKDIKGKIEIVIENMNNPLLNLESDKNWKINLFTIDNSSFVITMEHKEILEKVSHDICSKKFIKKFVNIYEDTTMWKNSHLVLVQTPQLIPLLVEPINQQGLLEDPLIIQLRVRFPDTNAFNKCIIELKSIHRFTSAGSRSEHRFNMYNHKLVLPNSVFKPVERDETILQIEKESIKNNDIIQFAINVNKYNNKEYWKFTLICLNNQDKYVREAQTLFTYPIENKKIFISDLYLREKVGPNTYRFYLNIFVFDEKEVEIKLSLKNNATNGLTGSNNAIVTNFKTHLTDACEAYVHTSCYNLVFHECSKSEQAILYQINSYKSTNKHFTALFPLVIPEGEKQFHLQVNVETKKHEIHVQKDIQVRVDDILIHNAKAPCVNNLISVLKKYKTHEESHLFLLFKTVNCHKIYEPFLINHQNNETFYAKVDSSENNDKFTFQKMYRQTYPTNYQSISQNIFDSHVISIITIVLIDDSLFLNTHMRNGKEEFLQFLKNKKFPFRFNKYYVVNYSNQNVLINLYKYIDAGNVKIDIVQKSSDIQNVAAALDKVIAFAENAKQTENYYMHSEYSILLLTDIKGMENVKTVTDKYVKSENDINKNFSRIYVISFENGHYSNSDMFNESIQSVRDMYTYNKKMKDDILFISFHKYTIDERLMLHYAKAVIQDYILLHIHIYKTAWYLIGICRYNIIKNSPTTRKLHLYYVDKNVKTVTYTISSDEAKKVLDNSSPSSFQDMCNIFTQTQLLGHT